MNELNSMTFLGYPVGLLAVTIVITVVASAIASSISAVLAVRLMADRLGRLVPAGATATAVAAPRVPMAAEGVSPAVIAAISAAVYSTLGTHRIVYIGGPRAGTTWTNELRTQHHTSHAVTRVHHSND
jgi:hypothetical protein